MTFDPTPPTEPGFYAWKSTAASAQVFAAEVYKFGDEPELSATISGIALGRSVKSWGGLWCRLVPALNNLLDVHAICDQRDAARAEAAKWREAAVNLAEALIANDDVQSLRALKHYDTMRLCPSPPQSSPSSQAESVSSAVADMCVQCRKAIPIGQTMWHSGGKTYCRECRPKYEATDLPPQSADTARENAAPAEVTASRLQALESGLTTLQRAMACLSEHLSKLRGWNPDSGSYRALLPTEWPADLALTTLTCISPATQKPSSSDAGNSK